MQTIFVTVQKKAFSIVLYKSDDENESGILQSEAIQRGLISLLG